MRFWKITGAAVLVGLAVAGATRAADKGEAAKAAWKGSIKVEGKHSQAELKKMAKIRESDAKKKALAAVEGKAGDKKAGEAELEVENGYLIYAVDVKVKGKDGVEEILVDAGDGKVLAHEHESGAAEEKEKKEEKGRK